MGQAKWAFILIVGLLLFPPAAQSKDTSMRCGTDLIDIGNSKSGIEFFVERWTYDTSVGYFTILTFKGDRLVRLEDERKW